MFAVMVIVPPAPAFERLPTCVEQVLSENNCTDACASMFAIETVGVVSKSGELAGLERASPVGRVGMTVSSDTELESTRAEVVLEFLIHTERVLTSLVVFTTKTLGRLPIVHTQLATLVSFSKMQ